MKRISVSTKTAVALTSLLAGVFLAGSSHAADVDAAKLWAKNCQTCHGPDGKGKTKAGEKAGVKDLTAEKPSKTKAVESMKNGVKEKDSDKMAMKSYSDKLSADEIDALATYVTTLK